MKASEVTLANKYLNNHAQIRMLLDTVTDAEEVMIKFDDVRLELTPAVVQEIRDRITKDLVNRLNLIEKELEQLGVTP